MLVVSRTRGSSAIATWAITYGAGSPGTLNRWFTVNPARVALPETARTPRSRDRQYRHTGAGGWIRDWQALHSCSRRVPSAPEVQKNSFSAVIRGSGRPGAADTSPPGVGRPR